MRPTCSVSWFGTESGRAGVPEPDGGGRPPATSRTRGAACRGPDLSAVQRVEKPAWSTAGGAFLRDEVSAHVDSGLGPHAFTRPAGGARPGETRSRLAIDVWSPPRSPGRVSNCCAGWMVLSTAFTATASSTFPARSPRRCARSRRRSAEGNLTLHANRSAPHRCRCWSQVRRGRLRPFDEGLMDMNGLTAAGQAWG